MPKRTHAIAAIICLLALLGVSFLFLPDKASGPDSGIVACEEMAENVKSGKASDPTKKMTEAQYKTVHEKFSNSKHVDIKLAGTNLVNSVIQAESTAQTDLAGNLQAIVDLSTYLGDVRVACASHGVYIPAQS